LEEFCTCIYSFLETLVLKVVGFLKTLKYAVVKMNVKYKFKEIYNFRIYGVFKYFIRRA
jgi:hypothetical protein